MEPVSAGGVGAIHCIRMPVPDAAAANRSSLRGDIHPGNGGMIRMFEDLPGVRCRSAPARGETAARQQEERIKQ